MLRHGETDVNLARKLQGQQDFPLNETGIRQAEAVRREAEAEGLVFDRVYTSPLSRAVRTAEIVSGLGKAVPESPGQASADAGRPGQGSTGAGRQDPGIADAGRPGAPAVIPDDRLLEINFGPYEGKEYASIDGIMDPFLPTGGAPEGVEPLGAITERVRDFFEEILAAGEDGENILVVTHGVTMRGILGYIMGLDWTDSWDLRVPNCRLFAATWDGTRFDAPQAERMDGGFIRQAAADNE